MTGWTRSWTVRNQVPERRARCGGHSMLAQVGSLEPCVLASRLAAATPSALCLVMSHVPVPCCNCCTQTLVAGAQARRRDPMGSPAEPRPWPASPQKERSQRSCRHACHRRGDPASRQSDAQQPAATHAGGWARASEGRRGAEDTGGTACWRSAQAGSGPVSGSRAGGTCLGKFRQRG